MAVLVEEKYKGRRLDAGSAEILYLVTGTEADAGSILDEDAFNAVINSAPQEWFGLPAANVDVREELVQGTVWMVAAIYSASDPVIYQQSSVAYEFSFQAPQEKVYQSIQTKGIYDVNGLVDPSEKTFYGAINVTNDDGADKVEGLDLPAGTPTNTWIYNPLNATVTDQYQHAVEAIMGGVSSFNFKGRAGGTMRLVGVDGGALFAFGTIARWSIRFSFQFKANRSNFIAGGIPVDYKGGHDLLWAYYKDEMNEPTDPVHKGLIKRPQYLIVDQVFPEVNFGVLGI